MYSDEIDQSATESRDGNGDPTKSESFVRLFVANQRRIHGFIRTLLFQPADADDVLQETSITGLSKFPVFAEGHKKLVGKRVTEEFVTWICTIARYEALKFCRVNKKGIVQLDEALFDAIAERQTERLQELEARYEVLSGCLKKLSFQDQELLRGRYESNLTGVELAKSVGRSRNAVYKALWRIRRALLECVERNLKWEQDV